MLDTRPAHGRTGGAYRIALLWAAAARAGATGDRLRLRPARRLTDTSGGAVDGFGPATLAGWC